MGKKRMLAIEKDVLDVPLLGVGKLAAQINGTEILVSAGFADLQKVFVEEVDVIPATQKFEGTG